MIVVGEIVLGILVIWGVLALIGQVDGAGRYNGKRVPGQFKRDFWEAANRPAPPKPPTIREQREAERLAFEKFKAQKRREWGLDAGDDETPQSKPEGESQSK